VCSSDLSALRLETRRMAHEDGRWVREALAAAGKRRSVPEPAMN